MNLIAPPSEARIAFDHHYDAKSLLTATEAKFYEILHSISGHRCKIMCKPRLADVFQHEKSDIAAFNKISQKHIDFLICRNDDWTPMLGIELDDYSHNRKEVKIRDMFVNSLFAYVGVPLLRIHVSEVDQLESLVGKLSHAWRHRWKALDI